MLWLDKHKPEEKVIPPETQVLLDAGNEFGDRAMAMFGNFVETTTRKPNGYLDLTKMIEKTKEYLSHDVSVICEAAFSFLYNYCAVDILRKVDNGYEIYEVKDYPIVEESFVRDVGFQRYIAEKCGVSIKKCFIVCHGNDVNTPFVINDVTDRAKSYYYEVDDNLWRLDAIKKQKEEPKICMGKQCSCPYNCWYRQYCERNSVKTTI